MGFLAPLAGPIISGVGAIAGGLLGRSAGKPSNDQSQANNLLNAQAQLGNRLSQQSLDTSAEARNTGMGFLNRFTSALAAPQNYFQSLLSGNQAQTTAALAPDIARLRGQAQQGIQAASMLAPRGAGRSGLLFNLPQQAQAETAGLFNQARPAAAAGLTQIAQPLGAVGTNLMNTGVGYANSAANFLGAGTAGARSLSDAAAIQQAQRNQAGSQVGSGITGILGQVPWGKIFGGNQGGNFGTTPGIFDPTGGIIW